MFKLKNNLNLKDFSYGVNSSRQGSHKKKLNLN